LSSKGKGKKQKAYWLSIVVLVGLYVVTLWKAPDILKDIGSMYVISIAAATGLFQAAQCFDTLTISKHFRQELSNKE
jgi:hypothetical protein